MDDQVIEDAESHYGPPVRWVPGEHPRVEPEALQPFEVVNTCASDINRIEKEVGKTLSEDGS